VLLSRFPRPHLEDALALLDISVSRSATRLYLLAKVASANVLFVITNGLFFVLFSNSSVFVLFGRYLHGKILRLKFRFKNPPFPETGN